MLKRVLASIILLAVLCLSSCSGQYSKFYGAWYRDLNGERIAVQFSENDKGEQCFIWATYDIEKDEVLSISKGYYSIDGSTVTLDFVSEDVDLTLNYTFEDDKLIMNSETATLILTKKIIE